jgi:hypothetical protein
MGCLKTRRHVGVPVAIEPREGFKHMSLRSHTHLKLVGALGAAALAIGAAAAAPALAAGGSTAGPVLYTCVTPLGNATPNATYTVKSAPAKMAVGQSLGATAAFTLDANTTALAESLGWTQFNGTIQANASATKAGLALKFPKTALANGTAGSTNASATGTTLVGTKLGNFTFKYGDLDDVVLNGFDSSGKAVGTVEFPTKGSFGKCTNDAGTTTLMSGPTTPVVTKVGKDSTKTAESAKYSSKTHAATGTAKVKSKFGSKATGKVSFTLKKGSKTVKTASGKINKKGVASVSFKGVSAKGTYSITGKYAGSKTLTGSSGKATFKVS